MGNMAATTWQLEINVPQFHRRGSQGRFLALAPVWMGLDGPCDSFGPIFKPNVRFWTHLKIIFYAFGASHNFGRDLTSPVLLRTIPEMPFFHRKWPPLDLASPAAARELAAVLFFERKWPHTVQLQAFKPHFALYCVSVCQIPCK